MLALLDQTIRDGLNIYASLSSRVPALYQHVDFHWRWVGVVWYSSFLPWPPFREKARPFFVFYTEMVSESEAYTLVNKILVAIGVSIDQLSRNALCYHFFTGIDGNSLVTPHSLDTLWFAMVIPSVLPVDVK
jgi:hypothetical protein